VQSFLRGIHVVDYTEAALAASRTTWSRSPAPRTCPRTRRRRGAMHPAAGELT
jgi:hypothetical protein